MIAQSSQARWINRSIWPADMHSQFQASFLLIAALSPEVVYRESLQYDSVNLLVEMAERHKAHARKVCMLIA